ncbi:MAG: lytic transglycosylase [Hyphomicrobiales bacterium]|nr:lytic transglycosylase [Hyphomicrobiales bacterium]
MPALSALMRAAALTAAFAAPALPACAQTVAPKQNPVQNSAPTSEHAPAPVSKPNVKRVAKTAPAVSPATHAAELAPRKTVQNPAQTTAPTSEHAPAPASKPNVKHVAKTAPAVSPAGHAPEVAQKKAVQNPAQTTAPTSEHAPAPASKPNVKRVAKTTPAVSPASLAPQVAPREAVQTSAPTSEHAPAPAVKPRLRRVAKTAPADASGNDGVKALVSLYAQRHGVPETLAHRIVIRESRYNPALRGGAHFGLMQISLPTAKQMGYAGAPQGLLDARTNLSYGMPYLANAWLVSGGSEARAVSLYSRGYYYDAKRKGVLKELRTARSAPVVAVEADAGGEAQ